MTYSYLKAIYHQRNISTIYLIPSRIWINGMDYCNTVIIKMF